MVANGITFGLELANESSELHDRGLQEQLLSRGAPAHGHSLRQRCAASASRSCTSSVSASGTAEQPPQSEAPWQGGCAART